MSNASHETQKKLANQIMDDMPADQRPLTNMATSGAPGTSLVQQLLPF
jgi:hypothetical protein